MKFIKKHLLAKIGMVGLALLSLFFATTFLKPSVVRADSDLTDSRLITIYDRGKEISLISHADTVAGVLKQAGITLDTNDIVEPGLSENLVASSYYINIYRARPVTVIDGNVHLRVMTAYQTADLIAKNAGIILYPEDKTEIMQSQDLSSGAGLEMIITRAKLIHINLFGKDLDLRTQKTNVADFLNDKKIALSTQDRSSLSGDSPIIDGMNLRIWREGEQTISVEEAIDYDIQQIADANHYIGYKEVKVAGANGRRNVTYQVTIINGVEASRTEIASVVIAPAVTQIEVVGTRIPGPAFNSTAQKVEWLTAAGINQADWGYADYIIQKESNWNPSSINSSSGACGLVQALPCSKVPGNPYNPVDNLKWADTYANGRYGGWGAAYNYWVTYKWW